MNQLEGHTIAGDVTLQSRDPSERMEPTDSRVYPHDVNGRMVWLWPTAVQATYFLVVRLRSILQTI